MYQPTTPVATTAEPQRTTLQHQLHLVSSQCTQCQRCVAECQFLKNSGDPNKIADGYDPDKDYYLELPFKCSLCGLCSAVCPEQLNLPALFLEMRRETVDRGAANYPEHKRLENYEKTGTSKRFSWYALPAGCDSIFFPGCGLPGTRPEQTLKTFELLQRSIPNLGMVLDCCTKPSHDLGKETFFHSMFDEMKQYLLKNGVKQVLTACSNCTKIFSDYAPEFKTGSIYEILDAGALSEAVPVSGTVTIHDPCVARFSDQTQAAVRSLTKKTGLQISETRHSRSTTLCCGKGGAVDCLSPKLANQWGSQQAREAAGKRTITYCTGCASNLANLGPTSHILDLILDPQTTLAGKAVTSKAPFTYLNRLKVKKTLQKNVAPSISRERSFGNSKKINSGQLIKLTLLAFTVSAILVIKSYSPGM